MNDYRHVCFKDLENYFKRDDYFGNLTSPEKKLILENLGAASSLDIKEIELGVVEKTYEEIKTLADSSQLILKNRYIISDFQTIYTSNTGATWGIDVNPSKVYSIILTPASESTFDSRVSILHEGVPMNWEVRYDFTQETLLDGTLTKGRITYLKDQNNNSAYYDFKNYMFATELKSSEVTGLERDVTIPMFTFSKLESGVRYDNSDSVFNNHFEEDCWENVIIGDASNNHFYGGFKKNLFLKGCEYNKFEWNTTNNKFKEKVSYTQGSIKGAIVDNTNYDSTISKEFKMLQTSTSSEPVFVVTYLDEDTLTTQVIRLNKI